MLTSRLASLSSVRSVFGAVCCRQCEQQVVLFGLRPQRVMRMCSAGSDLRSGLRQVSSVPAAGPATPADCAQPAAQGTGVLLPDQIAVPWPGLSRGDPTQHYFCMRTNHALLVYCERRVSTCSHASRAEHHDPFHCSCELCDHNLLRHRLSTLGPGHTHQRADNTSYSQAPAEH